MPYPALRLEAARVALGIAVTDDLVAAAHAALEAGVYALGLGELITRPGIDWDEASRWFADALAELGHSQPDTNAAMRVILAHHLRPLAEGTTDPATAVFRLWTEIDNWGHGDIPDLVPAEVRSLLRHTADPSDARQTDLRHPAVEFVRRWCEADRVHPDWRTETVLALADAITADRAFDRLPILADALEEAGCDNADILAHLRDDTPHADWCWAVAAITGGPYSDRNIRTLRGVEHIRRYPGMYVGNTTQTGLNRVLFVLVANALTEAVAGHGREVRVELRSDGSVTVSDDGRSVPIIDGVPTVAPLLTNFSVEASSESGRAWFDHVVANALSTWCHVETRGDGHWHRAEFLRGEPAGEVRRVGPAGGSGLTITFLPDSEIFDDAGFDRLEVREYLRQAAFLHAGVELTFESAEAGAAVRFRADGGAADYVRWLIGGRPVLHPDVFATRGEDGAVGYDIAFQWTRGGDGGRPDSVELVFVNGEPTPDGGTPLTGFRAAVTRAVNAALRRDEPSAHAIPGTGVRAGLVAVVSIRHTDPNFWGATRGRITNPDARTAVRKAVGRLLADRFAADPALAFRIAGRFAAPHGISASARESSLGRSDT